MPACFCDDRWSSSHIKVMPASKRALIVSLMLGFQPISNAHTHKCRMTATLHCRPSACFGRWTSCVAGLASRCSPFVIIDAPLGDRACLIVRFHCQSTGLFHGRPCLPVSLLAGLLLRHRWSSLDGGLSLADLGCLLSFFLAFLLACFLFRTTGLSSFATGLALP